MERENARYSEEVHGQSVSLLPTTAFFSALMKLAEDAPGIPSRKTSHELPRIEKPTKWEYCVQDHAAKRRGRHFDLRLGDPRTGHAHSWAIPTRLPGPGEAIWAIQQPTHTIEYMDFEGEIPAGYGAGGVKLHERAPAEVLNATPGHISFNLYDSRGPREFVLHRIGDTMWKFMNRTPTRAALNVPEGKPDYKQIDPEHVQFGNDAQVMSAKIDDSHNLFVFPNAGKRVRVFSHRVPKRSGHDTNLIEHTDKVPELRMVTVPSGMGDSVFRGGVYAIHPKTGKATDAHILGGLLNSDVWASREKQKEHGELRSVLYDVERYRGKDVSKAPYAQKLALLRKVVEAIPAFHLPPMAFDERSKRRLLSDIGSGKLPHTKEGVVLWDLKEGKPPTKVKFKKEHDVYVRRFFAGEGKYRGRGVGGFEYSHTPEGPIVGKVGTGLSDALRSDMHQHPERYLGAVGVVEAMERYKGGALRAPAFKNWHLDKNDPALVEKMVPR